MKIATVTLHLHTNFGGIMQAYALQTVLERMGHQVEVLDRPFPRYRNLNTPVQVLRYAKRMVTKIFNPRVHVFLEKDGNAIETTISRDTQAFIDKYIHVRRLFSYHDVTEGEYDAFVVGSDQIWRKRYFSPLYPIGTFYDAFLHFTNGWQTKRLAYAASFGTDEWELDDATTKECAHLVRNFDAVSVREKSAIALCGKYLCRDATQTLDPTLLLDKNDYVKLIEDKGYDIRPNNNLFCYVLDQTPEIESVIDAVSVAKDLHKTSSHIVIEDNTKPLAERVQRPVEEWLKGFAEAEFVITDSFHACVFSIVFQKPFVVVGNARRGQARFESLLSTFGLENRLCDVNDSARIGQLLSSPIDWTAVNGKLEDWKRISIDFLTTNLM